MNAEDEPTFRAYFDNARDAMLVCCHATGAIVDANRAAEALHGRPRAALLGLTAASLHEGLRVVRPDGTHVPIELTVTENVAPDRDLVVERDVTARARREAMSERYQLLSKFTRDIVLFVGKGGVVLEANEAAARAYGYTRDELLTRNVRDLRGPGTVGQVEAQMQQAFEHGILFETVHVRRDGTPFPVEVGSRSAEIDGEVVLLSIIRDVTERKQMDATLLQADRLAAVGTLAAGVAHEINNPLACVIANIELVARKLTRLEAEAATEGSTGRSQLDELSRLIEVAREGADRVRLIVRDLKTYARGDEDTRRPIDVRAVLDGALSMAQSHIRGHARVVREYGEVPLVHANDARLGQVFLNLIVNAAQAVAGPVADALPQRHEIRITTRTDMAGRAVIEVHDTGPGIPDELLERVFDPFVTTKPVGEGTGLGLFVSHAIVASHGGEISAETRIADGARVGATLRVVLPPHLG